MSGNSYDRRQMQRHPIPFFKKSKTPLDDAVVRVLANQAHFEKNAEAEPTDMLKKVKRQERIVVALSIIVGLMAGSLIYLVVFTG